MKIKLCAFCGHKRICHDEIKKKLGGVCLVFECPCKKFVADDGREFIVYAYSLSIDHTFTEYDQYITIQIYAILMGWA